DGRVRVTAAKTLTRPRLSPRPPSPAVRERGLRPSLFENVGYMSPFIEFPRALSSRIRFVLTDVDDTLTDGPRLPAAAYLAIERLQAAGTTVVPVTAAPAGWCDLMCRMWPVGAVIGENGGLCFRHERAGGATLRHYWAE